jgi:nucleoside 2-deoxyribosyltransferase
MKARLYFAAPLFSDAERSFNEQIAAEMRTYFEVYLPQEDGGLMVDMIADGVAPARAAETVFRLDTIAIKKCEVLLIVLDGRAIDEGAAFELGYAYAQGKCCVGLQTDPRRLLLTGNNPMIDCAVSEVFLSVTDLLAWARAFVLANTDYAVQTETVTRDSD